MCDTHPLSPLCSPTLTHSLPHLCSHTHLSHSSTPIPPLPHSRSLLHSRSPFMFLHSRSLSYSHSSTTHVLSYSEYILTLASFLFLPYLSHTSPVTPTHVPPHSLYSPTHTLTFTLPTLLTVPTYTPQLALPLDPSLTLLHSHSPLMSPT